MKENKYLSTLSRGILKENPVFILILGTCPTLATTTNVLGAFSMGIAAMIVLICSNVLISLLRKIIPETVRIPCYIVIIASFVTVVKMLMQAFFNSLYGMLGVYLDLITVNCIILGRAEMFASKNEPLMSALDGVGMGLGFTVALTAMSVVREVFGSGSFAGIAIPFMENYKIAFLANAPGGMLVYGLLIATVYAITHGKGPKKTEFSCAGCPAAGSCGGSCITPEGASADDLAAEKTPAENSSSEYETPKTEEEGA